LFIVDYSDESWKGLKYFQDWTEIAGVFDAVIEKHDGWPSR
jgi:hypothetical protein